MSPIAIALGKSFTDLAGGEYRQTFDFDESVVEEEVHENSDTNSMEHNQARFYHAVQGPEIVARTLAGRSSVVLAYGQTGSGKTFTIFGDDASRSGVLFRVCEEMFERKTQTLPKNWKRVQESTTGKYYYYDASTRQTSWEPPPTSSEPSSYKLSFYEVYNDKVVDLLSETSGAVKKPLRVRLHPVDGPFVENLVVVEAASLTEVHEALYTGHQRRKVGSTDLNQHSSRSHAVFSVTDPISGGRVTFIDLAGSERADKSGARGARLLEASAINRSLSSLGAVIHGLASTKPMTTIPWRDSVLTWLMSGMLRREASLTLVATVSPDGAHYEETVSTLRFAAKARLVDIAALHPSVAAPTASAPALSAISKAPSRGALASGTGRPDEADAPLRRALEREARLSARVQSLEEERVDLLSRIQELQTQLDEARKSAAKTNPPAPLPPAEPEATASPARPAESSWTMAGPSVLTPPSTPSFEHEEISEIPTVAEEEVENHRFEPNQPFSAPPVAPVAKFVPITPLPPPSFTSRRVESATGEELEAQILTCLNLSSLKTYVKRTWLPELQASSASTESLLRACESLLLRFRDEPVEALELTADVLSKLEPKTWPDAGTHRRCWRLIHTLDHSESFAAPHAQLRVLRSLLMGSKSPIDAESERATRTLEKLHATLGRATDPAVMGLSLEVLSRIMTIVEPVRIWSLSWLPELLRGFSLARGDEQAKEHGASVAGELLRLRLRAPLRLDENRTGNDEDAGWEEVAQAVETAAEEFPYNARLRFFASQSARALNRTARATTATY